MPKTPSGSTPKPDHQGSEGPPRPSTEVPARPRRRTFTAAYKVQILEQADACRSPGEVGALLRREGLYSSHLSEWRRARRDGALGALSKRRGPKSSRRDPVVRENEQLKAEIAKLRRRLAQAEVVIAIQKKASEILGIPLRNLENDDDA